VEAADRFLSLVAFGELDERKPARPAGQSIDGQEHVRGWSDGREVVSEFRFGGGVRQVPDEQTDRQSFLA
jgi:hypothetical protein